MHLEEGETGGTEGKEEERDLPFNVRESENDAFFLIGWGDWAAVETIQEERTPEGESWSS